jgi:uncharacterized protein with HEPN domain
MREKPKDYGRLMHISDALANISEFLHGKSVEDFLRDKLLYYAVVKNLEIIGEAAYMLSTEFKESHPETTWKGIVRMRHILVHGYYQIDAHIVWSTIEQDLPNLEAQIKSYINEFT